MKRELTAGRSHQTFITIASFARCLFSSQFERIWSEPTEGGHLEKKKKISVRQITWESAKLSATRVFMLCGLRLYLYAHSNLNETFSVKLIFQCCKISRASFFFKWVTHCPSPRNWLFFALPPRSFLLRGHRKLRARFRKRISRNDERMQTIRVGHRFSRITHLNLLFLCWFVMGQVPAFMQLPLPVIVKLSRLVDWHRY